MLKFWRRNSGNDPHALVRQSLKAYFPGIRCARLIGQITCTEEAIEAVEDLVRGHDLPGLSALNAIDLTRDIIQIYIVEYEPGLHALVVVIDPYDPYLNPYVVGTEKGFRPAGDVETIVLQTIVF